MLNPRQIEAFRAVIETGTVGRAAERLCLSQPAVSKLIRNLEFATRLALFERQPGRVVPTPEALLLYAEVERVWAGIGRIGSFVEDLRGGRLAGLNIGVMPALAGGFIQDLLIAHLAEQPDLKVTLHALSTARLAEMVVSGALDLAVTAHRTEHPELILSTLCDMPLVCVLPPGSPLAAREEITPADLAGEPFLAFPAGSELRAAVDGTFSAAEITPRILLEAPMATPLVAMAARGLGVSVMPELYLGALALAVTLRPFRPRLSAPLYLLTPRLRPEGLAAHRFAQRLRDKTAGP